MAIDFTVNFSGTPSEQDIRGATRIIELENARRLTDVDDNDDPILPPLPYATGAELKASYLAMLVEIVTRAHASYIQQDDAETSQTAKELWGEATDAQRQAALTALGG